MQPVTVRRTFALCASLLTLAAFPATASATSSQAEIDAAIDNAVEYVLPQQEAATGAIPGFGGDWIATSLAAADIDTAAVSSSGGPSLQDYLLGEYDSEFWAEEPPLPATDYERAILVSHAAGLDPARLSADSNLLAQLAGRWNPGAGSFGEPSSFSTAFGILAMKTSPVPAWGLEPVVSYLRRNQHDDGGWTFGTATTPAAQAEPSETDMTGAAVAALCEAGVPAYDPDVVDALDYLQGLLVNATGAVHYAFGDNSDATAWVISGLNACGIDPQSPDWTTAAGKTPIDHLLSLQVPSGPEAGGFGYDNTSEANLYSTQDALRAIAGGVFTAEPLSRRPTPEVAAGTPAPHVLVIGAAPGNVRMCKVTAPVGASLTNVLSAAQAGSHPSGCVTSFTVAGGEVSSINGFAPDNQDEAWLLRLDRGSAAAAGEQSVGFGDVISLRLGERPSTQDGAGVAGPAGKAGNRGPRGRRGPKGKPGRNAHITCRAHRGKRSGKARIRCGVKKGKAKRR